ncbi:MAG: glycosyltransferase [Butyrivibrio sp.]|nr:glycosyltransferase [Butyrivibrio sp.]
MKKTDNRKKLLMIITIILLTIYIFWRIFCTLPIEYGIVSLVCGIVMLVSEILAGVETISHLITTFKITEPELPVIPNDMYPEVDVFIATHNEPLDVLYKTANGCKHMRYPDKNKVHIWFCDDGNRPSVAKLAEDMGIGYQGLANNKLAKAGNLNNALSKTHGELIATFDADMIPTRNFLMKTVPYFYLPVMKKLDDGTWVKRSKEEIDPNYKVGFIQTPQSFYNPDLFQFNLYAEDRIPNEQDYFFREINVSRNGSNSPIYAGSNTLISREALEGVGGIATGTITEDFETGLHIQEAGYTCYATSDVYAHGLAPDTVDSLIKQRERWGRGCIFSLHRAHVFRDKKIPFKSRFSYFACELYWWSYLRRFVFMLAPILFMIFNVPVIICTPLEMYLFWLPSYLATLVAMKSFTSDIRNSRWSNVVDTVMFPYLIIPILMEAFGFRKRDFHVTEKKRAVNNNSDALLAVPHIILAILSLIAIFRSFGQVIEYESFGPLIVLFWLCLNLYALVLACFFMLGRSNSRLTERYIAEIPAKLRNGENEIFCRTHDVSEGGLSLLFDRAVDIPVSGVYDITLKTHHYTATVKAKLVYFVQEQDEYKYSFTIVGLDEPNKGEYFQIVYDRHPTLPDKIEHKDSAFLDVKENIEKRRRINRTKRQRRRNIRADVEKLMNSDVGKVYIVNYNFRYVLVDPAKTPETKINDNIKIYPISGNNECYLDCEYVRSLREKTKLYFIKNHAEIAFDEKIIELVSNWIENEA